MSGRNYDFHRFCENCRIRWLDSKGKRVNLPVVPLQKQKEQEEQIQEMLPLLDSVMYGDIDEEEMRDKVLTCLKKEGLWQLSSLDETEQNKFYEISRQFMMDARAFDENLPNEDIGQALRNVWIFLILEQLFQRPIQYHDGIFAYSMLYPYTDNFLDDQKISKEQKKTFNDWFTKRLSGETRECADASFEAVHRLVTLIEGVFNREEYPEVYDALLLIQNAQIKSLLQNKKLNEAKLLDISIEKGGASVVADGMLIDGHMSEEEYAFCVEFGFLLQIADDIQDMVEDQEASHYTLTTIAKNKEEREELVHQLLYFTELAVNTSVCPQKELLAFIKENCKQLILFSVLKSKTKYSGRFITQIKKRLPVRVSFIKAMKERFEDKNIAARFMDTILLQH